MSWKYVRALAGALFLTGCGLSQKAEPAGPAVLPKPGPSSTTTMAREKTPGGLDPLRPRDDLPPERRALIIMGDKEPIVDAEAAVAAGYTLVDLSDNWTPFLFQTLKNAQGEDRPNRYRRIFVGLASDQLDSDGQPLDPGEKNYLEPFGIPPSLSVLRERFLDDQKRTCEADVDFNLLAAQKLVRYVPDRKQRQVDQGFVRLRVKLVAAQRASHLDSLAAVAEADPKLAGQIAELDRWAAERAALREVEKRLACEGLLSPKSKHVPGVYDDAMHDVVRRFQQKHLIYESPYLRPKTMAALSRRMIENNYEALWRVLAERVASAAAILEDGSVDGKSGPPTYRSVSGKMLPVRNLVNEYLDAALDQLGLKTAAGALAFLQRHPAADFKWLRVAVKLPERPEYYSPHMELSVVVDRGDIWYDLPFDEQGKALPQQRQVYPSFTLYTQYLGQKVPLVRWRTTVGGWRSEQAADGYEYYRYKGSDIGPRIIRQVLSGPVWIAPESTPIRTLIKEKRVGKTYQTVVNYDEIGPGFRSAYGLVAGYFVVPGQDGKPDFDNGIRAHGSVDYLSIGSSEGYSHGCHRLLNHQAVRLYSFILQHRHMRVLGDQPLGYQRQFLAREQVYEMRIPSRGYAFMLEPPVPVSVLEGRIRGERKKPFTEYVPKPGVVYPGPPPPVPGSTDRSGGAAASKGEPEEAP